MMVLKNNLIKTIDFFGLMRYHDKVIKNKGGN